MKRYLVLRYSSDIRYASVTFTTDNMDDAMEYASLMSRNTEENYHVCSTLA